VSGGEARGYKSTVDSDKILAQEFNPDEPHHFMIDVIFRVLRAQALIFANLRDAIPEITDPLLLETRFPQFISHVNQLMDRAREYFKKYYKNDAEHTATRV
jgi:hypothetical protein